MLPRLPVLIAALALYGCATQQPVQNIAELRRTHGYVVAALPAVFQADQLTVTLRSLSSGAEVRLNPADGQALAAWVPAGSYEIAEMVGKDKGTLEPIQVTAGEATDLGGLTWANIGERQRVLLPLRHSELAERTAAATHQFNEHLGSALRQWNVASTPKPQNVPSPATNLGLIGDLLMLASEKANQAPLRVRLREATSIEDFTKVYLTSAAPLIGEPALDSLNTLYVGSNFGQLRRRDPSGEWRAIDTGTIAAITAVHVKAQTLVVGTSDGRVRFSADGGRAWQSLQRLGGSEYVFSIHEHEGRYLILTGSMLPDGPATFKMENFLLYEVHLHPAPRINLIRKFDLPLRVSQFFLPTIYASIAGQHYLVNTFNAIERLDLVNGTWKTIAVPHVISYLRVSTDGKLLTGFKAQGASSKLSVSSDGGGTWQSLDTPPYTVIDVRMESLASGTASRWDMGMFSSALQILNYDGQSKTWSKSWTSPPAGCIRTVRVGESQHLCVSNGGSVFRITPKELVPEFLAN